MAEPEKAKVPVVSSAKDFVLRRKQRDEAQPLELPSGLVVEVKRPEVDKLIKAGHIPSDLAVSLQKASSRGEAGLQGDDLKKYYELTDLVVVHSVVTPKVLKSGKELTDEQYEEGFVSIDDISETDKSFIMNFVQTGVADLKPFRAEQQS